MANFEIKGDYVLMTPDGPYDLKVYREALQEVAEFCRRNGLKKVLADISMRTDTIPVIDRFQLGIEMAKILGHRIKMAILAPPATIDRLGENSAVNRGGRVFVTSRLDQALEWLEKD